MAFVAVFPVLYGNVLEGVREADRSWRKLAEVYRIGTADRIRHIYFPSLLPYLISGASAGLGISWKAVVAAEVLTLPRYGLGTGMQEARLQLDTARLLAWTLLACLLSGVGEYLLRRAARRVRRLRGEA